MILVVVLHVCGQGGLIGKVRTGTGNWYVVWLFECFAYPAVDIFALISGFVGPDGREGYRAGRIGAYWLRVLFYTVFITAAYALLPGGVSGGQWLLALLPVTHGQYWYMTAFFGLLIVKPILVRAVQSASDRDAVWFLSLSFLLFSVLPTAFSRSVYGLSGGYSLIWLVLLFLSGGMIRKLKWEERVRWYAAALLLLIGSAATFAGKVFGAGGLVKYTSPTVLLSAVGWLLLFSRMKIRRGRKVLAYFSEASLSCYLIHVHPLVWETVMKGISLPLLKEPWPVAALGIALFSAGIFLLTAILDFPRQCLFRKFGSKKSRNNEKNGTFVSEIRYNQ